ncbi:MAG: HD domain-containing protein [Candidatus Bruticola sp.]
MINMSFEVEAASYEPLPVKYLKVERLPEHDERVKSLSNYLPSSQQRFFLDKVYPFTYYFHCQQKRHSGEPYIVHPISVAEILSKYQVDLPTLSAALMHDVYEDHSDEISLSEIRCYFGCNICNMEDGLTKIGIAASKNRRETAALREQLPKDRIDSIANQNIYNSISKLGGQQEGSYSQTSPEEAAARAKRIKIANKNASLAKLLLGIASDPRVILIKLADRLDNMRTLDSLRPDKQQRIARETLEFFCPIADRFGVWEIKKELEDLCFRYLYKNIYNNFKKQAELVRAKRRGSLEKTAERIRNLLNSKSVAAEVHIKDSSLYTVFRRMENHGQTSIDDVIGLSSIVIVADSESSCYTVEGLIKSNLSFCGSSFYKDYISLPKANKYKAIHMAVWSERHITKIRIFSAQDLEINNIGVFSEFKGLPSSLEDSDVSRIISKKWATWIQSLRALHDVAAENTDFLDWAMSGTLTHSITCFTSCGDMVNLPIGATPLDFAFALNVDLGLKCEGALVNDQSVSCLDYKLKDNDFVKIISSDSVIIQRSWFDCCCTPEARSALSTWYKNNYSAESNRAYGQKLLTSVLIKANLPGMQNNEEFLKQLAQKCTCPSVQEMLEMIGTRRISLKFVREQLNDCLSTYRNGREDCDRMTENSDISALVHIRRFDRFKVCACSECLPLIGDDIFVMGAAPGQLILHRRGCADAEKKLLLATQSSARQDATLPVKSTELRRDLEPLVIHENASWLEDSHSNVSDLGLRAELTVKSVYSFSLAAEIIVCCNDRDEKIYNLKLDNNFVGGASSLSMLVGVSSLSELESLISCIKKIDGVVEVTRI